MAFRVAAVAFILTTYFLRTHSKVYHRCELAYELRDIHEIPENQLATWLCIANYESHFNTSAHNPGSGDHGLFQISELYWCSPPGVGFACGLPCAAFKDDDIEDDVICARRIYREHQRLSGDGFTAWVVYNLHCRNQDHVNSFLEGCFDEENLIKYPYDKYDYQEMNLPTIMTTIPQLFPLNFTTEKSTTPRKQEKIVSSTTVKPKPSILTTVTSAKPQSKPKYSTPTPVVSTTLSPASLKPTKLKQPLGISTRPTTQSSILGQHRQSATVTAKPKYSTQKLLSTVTKAKLSSFYSIYTPTVKSTFSIPSTRKPRIRLTTPRRVNAYDATRPFPVRTTPRPAFSTLSNKIRVTSVVTPTTPVSYNINDYKKSIFLKPRETKTVKYKPFEFNKNEVVYAVINKPNYSYAISSNGFKFVRTVR